MKKLAAGDLVLLRRKGGIELALVAAGPGADDPEWFRATTEEGKVRRFPLSIVVHGPVSRLSAPGDDVGKTLAQHHERLTASARAVDRALLHECALAEPRAYSIDELAELLLDDPTGDTRAALYLALTSDDSPFAASDEGFVPLTPAALEAREAERAREREQDEARKRKVAESRERKRTERSTLEPELKRLVTGRIAPDELSDVTREWLDGLRAFIVENPQTGNGDLPYGDDLVRIRDESHAVQLLARAGLWDPDREDLHAIRAEIGAVHPEDVLAEARALVPDAAPAEDLTALHTFTVDSTTTRDLDDAISLEALPDGAVRVHVHIADVARWIRPGTALDRWGRDAGESVYLPEVVHHLFPHAVVERTSLDPGVERAAITMHTIVTPAGELIETTFMRTRVRSDERLDYEAFDRRLREDAAWADRSGLVDRLQQRRVGRGATIALLPDLEVEVNGSQIKTRVKATDTLAHRLVAELMILFNEQVGVFFAARGVPAIYKTQPIDPTPPEYPELEDPLYFPKIVRLLRPSVCGLDPAPHAFIGAGAYAQATSPIRRYQDLVHQRQLVAVLEGTAPPHTRPELELLYPVLEARGGDTRRVERRRRRYWVLKRLSQLRGDRLRGIVSQMRAGGRPIVFFPDYLMETGLLLPPDFTVEVGDEIYVTPQKVDPIRGGFWARPAG